MDGTIFAELSRWSDSRKNSEAVRFLGRDGSCARLDFGELSELYRQFAAELDESGIGRVVALASEPGPEWVAAALGIMYSGRTVVPTFTPTSKTALRDPNRLTEILARSKAAAIVSSRTGSLDPGDIQSRTLDALVLHKLLDVRSEPDAVPSPDTSAFYQFSSGSTGTPRGVNVLHRNLVHNLRQIAESVDLSRHDRFVSWLPPFHDMGLVGGILAPLYCGGGTVLMAPETFTRDPIRWFEAISTAGGTHTAAPDFAYRMCVDRIDDAALAGVDLSSWRVAVNGAEPVKSSTMRAFCDRFNSHGFSESVFRPSYGLAEATLLVATGTWAGQYEREAPAAGGAVHCGPPVAGTEVVIVDPETGVEVAAGGLGEILVRGQSVANGYVGDHVQTTRTFDTECGSRGSGFLRTGDLGRLEGGNVVIVGRMADSVRFRGMDYPAETIEALAATVWPGSTICAAVVPKSGQGPVLVCERPRNWVLPEDFDRRTIRAVVKGCGLKLAAVVIVEPGSIPRTPSGKIRRFEAAQLVER